MQFNLPVRIPRRFHPLLSLRLLPRLRFRLGQIHFLLSLRPLSRRPDSPRRPGQPLRLPGWA